MKLIADILFLEYAEYVKDEKGNGVCTVTAYEKQLQRGTIKTTGRGGNGRQVMIEFESLPPVYKQLVIEKYDDPYEYSALQPLRDLIKRIDVKAIEFFDRFELPNGNQLSVDHRREYVKAAQVMRMIDFVYGNKKWLKKELRIELVKFWEIVGTMPETKSAGLPTSSRKLRPRYDAWKQEGYKCLVSKKFCNENRKKVNDDIENLILSLYTNNNKPYASVVLDHFERFMAGKVQIVDIKTGELFNPEEFIIDDAPVKLSKTTVWNIINNPLNRVIVDKQRMSKLEFSSTHRPFHNRKAPVYSFSKITMDDLSIPFKMEDGKRVWSYQIFDVASGCIVGKAFARSNDEGSGKNRDLFKNSMADMFKTIVRNGWKMPAEIEVEDHISNTFVGKTNDVGEFVADLLSEGYLFPFVRFCNPENPQEKRAEHNIKGKKYQFQNKREGFQRRPFSRLEANRLNKDKNNVRFSFEEIVANELSDINEWNNQLHPKQDIYKGLTRWQVLQEHQNPELVTPHLPTLAKYIGGSTATSINRTFCMVKHSRYIVSNAVLNSGRLNSTIVTAHYISDKNGEIPEVYLYQNDEYICTCKKLGAYQEAKAEQTEDDLAIRNRQSGHVSSFDASVKDRVSKLKKLKVIDAEPYQTPEPLHIEEPVYHNTDFQDVAEYDSDYWNDKALEDL